ARRAVRRIWGPTSDSRGLPEGNRLIRLKAPLPGSLILPGTPVRRCNSIVTRHLQPERRVSTTAQVWQVHRPNVWHFGNVPHGAIKNLHPPNGGPGRRSAFPDPAGNRGPRPADEAS